MDPHEHDSDFWENAYPSQDYFSTDCHYRPPRRPRNYGWLIAFTALLLLLISGVGSVTGRVQNSVEEEPEARETSSFSGQLEAEKAAVPMPLSGTSNEGVLGNGTKLPISSGESEELSLQEIYKKLIPSVVSITAMCPNGTSTGTGIIFTDNGYVITNYHVVSTAHQVEVLVNSQQSYSAAIVGGDETSDLMVLKIEADGLTPAEFGDSDLVAVGDPVVAIGDPLGTELRGTMTSGIICGINRDVDVGDRTMTMIQTDAALNSGNSGGPLVNMQGQVIGINTMKISSRYSTSVEGIGLAIPIAVAKPIVDELTEKGYVTGRPAAGFTIETLSNRVVLYYRLPGNLLIQSVEESSDAAAQGIEEGDIIVSIEGTRVSSADEFNSIKNEFSAGDTVTLSIFHQGTVRDVTVTLMDRADIQ